MQIMVYLRLGVCLIRDFFTTIRDLAKILADHILLVCIIFCVRLLAFSVNCIFECSDFSQSGKNPYREKLNYLLFASEIQSEYADNLKKIIYSIPMMVKKFA